MSKVKLPNRLKVFINQKLVKEATQEQPEFCPMALAIKAKLPRGYKAFVYSNGVDVLNTNGTMVKRYYYSAKVGKKIDHYDNTGEFPGGSVVLDTNWEKVDA